MLLELRLENYAVIDHVAVEFAAGLNLLTGETGAGKSILIDALALLLGEKASSEVIRSGCEKAVVTGVFEPQGAEKAMLGVLEANGIDSDESSVIIRREISSSGKGRVFINNQPATVSVLRQLGPHLATIHAQNESLLSFDGPARRALLDQYAGIESAPCAAEFERWKAIRDRMAELERDEQDRLRLLDLWSFQRREISEAKLQAGDDERLEAQKRVLANAEKIYGAAMSAFELLYEGNSSTSSTLRQAERQVEELARYEPGFQEARSALESARITVEDIGSTLRDYASGVQASPEALADVEDRLARIDRLKRKYGPTLDDVIRLGEEVGARLSDMESKDDVLRRLSAELTRAAADYLAAAGAVSQRRREAAVKLEKLVESEINELAMRAKFRIEVSSPGGEGTWGPAGIDEVSCLIATNPGEPLRPLEQIASGGELARVMLALKASVEGDAPGKNGVERRRFRTVQRTMIFDEVDSGIGGRAAEAVGKRLKALSRRHQVLCVTHLPQIATFADHHYLIEKKESSGRTRTTVRPITGQERTGEIARMISGAKVTDTSLKHAEQMIKANA